MMNIRFNPPWWGILLLISGLCLFIKLGLWQWSRAEEKVQLLEASKKQATHVIDLSANQVPNQYQTVQAVGQFDDKHVFLLDNRYYHHRFGFEVLVPYKLKDNQYVLVDRGWVEGSLERKNLPQINPTIATESIQGVAYYPSKKIWTLGKNVNNQGQWPLVIEKIDFKQIAKVLNISLLPFVLRLDAADPNAFVRDWRVVTMLPVQHKGYAFQWFGMAIAAIIIFLVLNLERRSA